MSVMYARMGLAIGESLFNQQADKLEYKLAKATQKYNRTMSALASAGQYNAITENEISLRDSGMRTAEAIQIDAMNQRADAESSAAAAGVRGGSVAATMRGIQRDTLRAKAALQERMFQQRRQSREQRTNVARADVYGRDISVIPRPSTATALLGLGASIIDIYDSHQPKGQTLLDRGLDWGRK